MRYSGANLAKPCFPQRVWQCEQKGKERYSMKTIRFPLVASIMFAMVFTFSCSEKCGDKKYDPEIQFCYNDSNVVDKCSGKEYNPETQFCGGNDIVDKCGDKNYDPETQFCYNDSDVVDKCDGKEYDLEKQFCHRKNLFDKCGGIEYNPQARFCDTRDNKLYKYVIIGEQTWMAENLNYAAKGSKCYNNKSANCEKYGRLYNWATAMKACPKGWHLPSEKEWSNLEKAVGGKLNMECEDESDCCYYFSTAGNALKSQSGWNDNGNGEDEFGFSALPSGVGNSDGSFNEVGILGIWWSSNDYNNGTWYRFISKYNNKVDWGGDPGLCSYGYNGWNASLFSVRCVQD
jgi:uncharacterized protein (TIGR02145 family)